MSRPEPAAHQHHPRLRRLTAAAGLAAVPLTLGLLGGCQSGAGGPPRPGDVAGSYIVTISDADMLATAFSTNQLGERDPSARDTLTVIALPIREPQTPFAQLDVPNSVMGPPDALAVSPDGRFAFVVESRGQAGPGARTVDDLPMGETLYCIDLTDPLSPAAAGSAYTGSGPTAVDVHPDGDLVAVATRNVGAQLVLIPVREGRPAGDPMAWPLMGVVDSNAVASSVSWDPSGRLLAVTLPDLDQVIFYEFRREHPETGEARFTLGPYGEPVSVGKFPYSGSFTPDGRHFITTDLQWGPDVEGFLVGAAEGRLSVIRLSDERPPDVIPEGEPSPRIEHRVVSTATVGVSPEGLAISPDGTLVATANLLRSFLPEDDPRLTRGGSVSLLSFDARTGQLTPLDEAELDGMPEGLSFDAAGRFIVVTQFRSFDPAVVDGELAFLRVNRRGRNATLEMADFRVGVGKGPHGVLIVR